MLVKNHSNLLDKVIGEMMKSKSPNENTSSNNAENEYEDNEFDE